MSRVSFHTLGCKLNFAESGALADGFRERQFEVVEFGQASDVVVINTCTVTAEADRKCRQSIRRAQRANPDACIIVTGCLAQLQPEEVASIDGVDFVLGAHEKFRLFDVIDAFDKQDMTQVEVSCIDEVTSFGPAYSAGERTRAFLKIQDGCDYSCSFCTIPKARGRSRSALASDVLAQAREIAERGVQEIVLSGVNIGLFGLDREGSSLIRLLRSLDKVDGIERYRISSIEPNLLTDEIIDFVAGSRTFMPHFHVPLQSGDDVVLGKMRRRYRSSDYLARAERIFRVMPDAALGADIIVGFPAESPERFQNTFDFLADLSLAYLHVFTYSERPLAASGMDVARFGPGVEKSVRSARSRKLRLLSRRLQSAFYARQAGLSRPVLWEMADSDGLMAGWTDNYVRVEAPYDAQRTGRVFSVRLGPLSPDGRVTVGRHT